MARLARGSLLSTLSGQIGKEIVIKQYADKVVVSRYPDMSRVKPTERQVKQRSLMAEANAYASRVKRDPQKRAEMEKTLKPGESIYHKAKQQYFDALKKGVRLH